MDYVSWALMLTADLWAGYCVLGSGAALPARVGWLAAIVLLPVAGFLAWLLYGPRGGSRPA